MTFSSSNRRAAMNDTGSQPSQSFDAWIIDEEFDDMLDRELANVRETLSDSRYF